VLPDPQHRDVLSLEGASYLLISPDVLRNLRDPEGLIRRWHPKAFLARVPKAAVNKYRDSGGVKIEVGAAEDVAGVQFPA